MSTVAIQPSNRIQTVILGFHIWSRRSLSTFFSDRAIIWKPALTNSKRFLCLHKAMVAWVEVWKNEKNTGEPEGKWFHIHFGTFQTFTSVTISFWKPWNSAFHSFYEISAELICNSNLLFELFSTNHRARSASIINERKKKKKKTPEWGISVLFCSFWLFKGVKQVYCVFVQDIFLSKNR